ncbi:FAD-linked oxidase C-terminal domain-containing protein [Paraburkholderia sediminicola]|uniref:FAD-linked oxidase C-terminal domain-containing protein n=1 Tax=Paraburkholderia sediminicola TaxID=458836 RepID=UPI0038B7E87E
MWKACRCPQRSGQHFCRAWHRNYKKPYPHMSRSAEELRMMRSFKNLFDPAGVINSGRVIQDLDE